MKKDKGLFLGFASIFLAVLLIDQLTKVLAQSAQKEIFLFSFLSIKVTTNTGISFGLLQSLPWIPTVAAMVVVIGIPLTYHKIPKTWIMQVCSSLILAGAAGNLVDRIKYGHVIDFIALSFWPTFNIADSAIVIGGVLYLLSIRKQK